MEVDLNPLKQTRRDPSSLQNKVKDASCYSLSRGWGYLGVTDSDFIMKMSPK